MITSFWLRRTGIFAMAMVGLFSAFATAVGDANTADKARVAPTQSLTLEKHSFAGYKAHLIGLHDFSATATFEVPKLRCGRAEQGIAPSVGTHVALGPSFSAAALFVGCSGGEAHYFPELVVNGSVKNYPTRVGHVHDTILLRLSENNEKTFVSVIDETHRFSLSRTGGGSRAVDLPWIGDAGWRIQGHHLEGVPDFGIVGYSDATIYGHSLGSVVRQVGQRKSRSSRSGVLQIKTGTIFRRGEAFNTVFKRA